MLTNRPNIAIRLDKTGKNFLLHLPFHLNHIARNAPNRRWVKGGGYWFMPGLRMNCKYVEDVVLGLPGLVVSAGVREYARGKVEGASQLVTPFPLRYEFKHQPYSKQLEALNTTWNKKFAFLAMDMGTGKSKVYTDTCVANYLEGNIDAVVFLTKFTLVGNILREVAKHCPLPQDEYSCFSPQFTTKGDKKKAQGFMAKKVGLKFLSVGLESLSGKEGGGSAFDYVWEFMKNHRAALIVDESHFIKNIDSNRTKNTISLGGLAVMKRAGTGTQISQGPFDLYAQYEFLNPDIIGIGNFYSFKARYGVKGGYGDREIVGYENLDELMELIRPHTFQVTKEEMVDLPPKIRMQPIQVDMTKEQKEVYDSIRKAKSFEIRNMAGQSEAKVVESILEVYMLLQQVCAGFVSYWEEGEEGRDRIKRMLVEPERNPKYLELLDTVSNSGGKQFNIWSRHVLEIKAVTKFLNDRGIKAVPYFGEMDEAARLRAEQDFVSGRVQCMVSNPETGGTGLTFVNCSNVIYLSNDFKLINRLQSEDRNHRIGTTKAVSYMDIVCRNSVEWRVLESLSMKKDMADYVRGMLAGGLDVFNDTNQDGLVTGPGL